MSGGRFRASSVNGLLREILFQGQYHFECNSSMAGYLYIILRDLQRGWNVGSDTEARGELWPGKRSLLKLQPTECPISPTHPPPL